MDLLKKLAVTVLFLSSITTGAVLGCDGGSGGGPASSTAIAAACDHVCQCAVEAGFVTAAEKAACVTDCQMNAAQEGATAACVSCIQRTTCDAILGSDACDVQCNPPEPESDAGAGARKLFTVR